MNNKANSTLFGCLGGYVHIDVSVRGQCDHNESRTLNNIHKNAQMTHTGNRMIDDVMSNRCLSIVFLSIRPNVGSARSQQFD